MAALAPRCTLILAVGFALLAGAAAPADEGKTLDVDPVELVLRGREVAGRAGLSVTRDGITYLFADTDNLRAFEREPERFEIQNGGACARMGPLSGACRTDIRAVHAGRLYVFASPQCRESFLKAPETLLESDDAVPASSAESTARGNALLDQALAALGGAEVVDAVTSCVERAERTEVSGGKEYRVVDVAWLGFAPGAPCADRLRRDQSWNDANWGSVIAEGRGARISRDARTPMVAPQQRAFEKEMGRELLAVLRNRRAPGAVIAHAGAGEVDGTAVEFVAVALDGRTTTLAIDPRDGAVVALLYRGRTESSAFANLVVRLSDWRPVGALKLPFARTVLAAGAPQPGLTRTLGTIEIDVPLDAALFRTTR